ncbi:MAG TPA: orotidine-5'-phosphate decarboxylase [Solirubrobacteraceae bacterium]|nr:orotidine-5'-phosphate decarboxylase [Solirubrobacteraceae bacterium]
MTQPPPTSNQPSGGAPPSSAATPADEEAEAGPRFADRLAGLVAARESQVVIGLDPDPQRLWPEAIADAAGGGSAAERAALAVTAHCAAVIDAAGAACVAVKLQAACFERLGAAGWGALRAVAEHARAAGLLVIADAKRGDIDVSAAAYGQALVGTTPTPFGPVAGLGADAFTANPYMGRDTLAVLTGAARNAAAGVFVLVRTSNPGAADLQDVATQDGEPVWARVARLVDELGAGAGPLADVGAVVGATAPAHIGRLRELMPRAPFLLPGVGAQGGRVEDLAPAFAPGPAGGLVTASRSIVAAHERSGAPPAEAARAEAERLRAAAWALA